MQRASDKTFKIGEKPKPDLPRLRKAEAREEKLSAKADRAWYRVWKARATSLKGLTAKAKLRRHWNLEDEDSEMIIFKSIIADLERMS
ncbi:MULTISPECIES: hypothetical protein [unclassified Mesorhizobium]|uniref:hypothetical protein n=2 Tax=Mesorhizobium TaxID=68287 RepID=UPI000F7605AE|nr:MULTISPECIES: hypothetical protein [unclassified Mesorhizobium]TGT59537.1 hypothetical protein EN813_028480 [Mesorhizobium sp. M00.F.Ca.ET.170.01.1.1]AZO12530.1 hypothetical protein EJ074_27955 [Mesorhizobium sp. M3A.F.Ca.ET.080.04.2.1]RWB68429.1 MAG: hypothetical protein EOQ49_23050 [Mesorhizobium sp.]RWB91015.1 MAG: hypothetical protein EOQ52_06135 [Mesorhizobium sp.]RWE23523.1 MAG: hypothetical protein EOS41_20355 [Mesorhizobium sp.]